MNEKGNTNKKNTLKFMEIKLVNEKNIQKI